ncbi:hypothetical protein VRK_31900 [Vibrio sp. MEBiC08052]|nr:hypothetical protein VRK_31900 [Vibrio sp. MEBiC08052]
MQYDFYYMFHIKPFKFKYSFINIYNNKIVSTAKIILNF